LERKKERQDANGRGNRTAGLSNYLQNGVSPPIIWECREDAFPPTQISIPAKMKFGGTSITTQGGKRRNTEKKGWDLR